MKRFMRVITAQGQDGRQYSLYVYSNSARLEMHPDPAVAANSGIDLATSDGQIVRWRAKGIYEIVATGVVLRSIERDAP